jgi:hypothetical protein
MSSYGKWGSVTHHPRHWCEAPKELCRRRCRWSADCHNKVTHIGHANGVALTSGCLFHVARWAKLGVLA